MKKTTHLLNLFLLLTIFIACEKEEILPIETVSNIDLKNDLADSQIPPCTGGLVEGLENGEWVPLEDVLVYANPYFSCPQLTTDDGECNYELYPTCREEMICMEYDTEQLNGVSTHDIVIILKHLLGIDEFDNLWKYIAADVNRDGFITATDIVIIRQLLLGEISSFPNSQNVVFVSSEFYNIANESVEELNWIKLKAFGNYDQCQDYGFSTKDRKAIKTGDVSGSWAVNGFIIEEDIDGFIIEEDVMGFRNESALEIINELKKSFGAQTVDGYTVNNLLEGL